jgi:hypothetical protein
MGEYIGRIYSDVRARPRYFIKKRVGHGHEYSPPPGKNAPGMGINQ